MANLGNTSSSALIRSANSTASQLASLTDAQMAYNWQFGAQDESSYSAYKTYLNGRAKTLSATGTIANAEKAQSFLTRSTEVDRSYRSGQIQQATLDIQEGNASDTDKLGLLKGLAIQAYQSGDIQNGQAIEGMYNSQSLKIQAQQEATQRAAAAGETKSQNAVAKQYNDAATALSRFNKENELEFQKNGTKGTYTLPDGSQVKGIAGYYKAKSQAYVALDNVYASGSQDPSLRPEQQASLADHSTSLQSGSDFAQFTSPQVLQALANGDTPFKVTTDPNTGTQKLSFNKIVGQGQNGVGIYDLNDPTAAFQGATSKYLKDKGSGGVKFTIQTSGGPKEVTAFPEMVSDATGNVSPDYSGKAGWYYMDGSHKVDVNPKTMEHVLGGVGQPNTFSANAQSTEAQLGGMGQVGASLAGINQIGQTIGQGVNDAVGSAVKAVSPALKHMAGQIPGVSILDALMHPDHHLDPASSDSWMAGVSHFFANPVSSIISGAKGIADARAQKFSAMAALNAKQLQAAQAAFQQAQAADSAKAATQFNPASNFAQQHFAPAPAATTPTGSANIKKALTQPVTGNPAADTVRLVNSLGYNGQF